MRRILLGKCFYHNTHTFLMYTLHRIYTYLIFKYKVLVIVRVFVHVMMVQGDPVFRISFSRRLVQLL